MKIWFGRPEASSWASLMAIQNICDSRAEDQLMQASRKSLIVRKWKDDEELDWLSSSLRYKNLSAIKWFWKTPIKFRV